MKLDAIIKQGQAILSKTKFKVKKNSPEILIVSGIVGVVVSTFMACKATTKLDDILEKGNERIEGAKAIKMEDDGTQVTQITTQQEVNKKLFKAYASTGLEVAKLYAPSAIGMTLSISAILCSHNIMQQRNVTLATAYAALDTSFKKYRERVAERLGEDGEKEIRYDISKEKFDETVTDENGKEKKKKVSKDLVNPDVKSPYAKFFDEGSRFWEKDAELNLMFLRQQERIFNDKLIIDKYVFLSDVYKALGIPETKVSRTVGWLYDPKNKNLSNYIDFGIYNTNREKSRDFVNGYERVILLDFNLDGPIMNKVDFDGLAEEHSRSYLRRWKQDE